MECSSQKMARKKQNTIKDFDLPQDVGELWRCVLHLFDATLAFEELHDKDPERLLKDKETLNFILDVSKAWHKYIKRRQQVSKLNSRAQLICSIYKIYKRFQDGVLNKETFDKEIFYIFRFYKTKPDWKIFKISLEEIKKEGGQKEPALERVGIFYGKSKTQMRVYKKITVK